jgi:hypothetical protein
LFCSTLALQSQKPATLVLYCTYPSFPRIQESLVLYLPFFPTDTGIACTVLTLLSHGYRNCLYYTNPSFPRIQESLVLYLPFFPRIQESLVLYFPFFPTDTGIACTVLTLLSHGYRNCLYCTYPCFPRIQELLVLYLPFFPTDTGIALMKINILISCGMSADFVLPDLSLVTVSLFLVIFCLKKCFFVL